ncbi:MAG: Holliday junction branch migration protein RuvA [Opitutales bacterium]|jgi:holliday junction DNA helicase RuvA|nr:Holliday junction branch migration protein RuvA [Opitutales bacterium]MDG2167384.1 Holliday junction branch migration protein RuvA [Opitutales bacterium]
MIASLKGKVIESHLLQVVIEAGGVGYEVHIPITTAEKLPPPGNEAKLYTHAVYRDDSQSLYGFVKREDREFFKLLVEKVSGVGPKMALTLFSKLSTKMLEAAIISGDAKLLSQCPGIGKKTAERLIIELRDKVGKGFGSAPSPPSMPSSEAGSMDDASATKFQDAIAALTALGYKITEADKSVNRAITKLGPSATVEEIIKTALNP